MTKEQFVEKHLSKMSRGFNPERMEKSCLQQTKGLARACKEKTKRCAEGLKKCEAYQERYLKACRESLDPEKAKGFIAREVRGMCAELRREGEGHLYIGKLREFQERIGGEDEQAETVVALKAGQVAESTQKIAELEVEASKAKAEAGVLIVLTGSSDVKEAGKKMEVEAKSLLLAAEALGKLKSNLGDEASTATLDAAIAALTKQARDKQALAELFESDGRNIVEKLTCAIGFC